MKRIEYQQAMTIMAPKLSGNGVFLTVGGENPNTMTIGWATVGYIWGKPVLMTVVRPQRYTYELLKGLDTFTVSVPTTNELRSALATAGSKSGRDADKLSLCGITTAAAQKVDAPIIKECGVHFECRILLRQDMTSEQMDETISKRCYPNEDYHTMFFGEIVDCYTTDE